jgi:low affinity Fe/Cu permease
MKIIYAFLEKSFERLTSFATAVLGNSISFIVASGVVIFWLSDSKFSTQDTYDSIKDVLHGIIFLSLFIIQKSFNRFTASLHVKVNELVASHDTASNSVINSEEKTEKELTELSKGYAELAEQAVDKEKSGN